jgi:hypothetical protein
MAIKPIGSESRIPRKEFPLKFSPAETAAPLPTNQNT